MTEQAQLLDAVLAAPPECRDAILKAASGTPTKARPGTVRQAAEILDCHPRTVKRYATAGMLQAIRITPRRVRYDLNEVENLAEHGAPTGVE